jgi:hypothetical protein
LRIAERKRTAEWCEVNGIPISFTCAVARCIVGIDEHGREIEEAICTLPSSERDKLLRRIPALFPELVGDAEWERLLRDERARPELSRLLDET